MTTLATPTSLPKDRENQTHVTVHALLVGGFWLPDKFVFQDCFNGPADVGGEVPDFAFMITHPTYGRALFDLGLRKVSIVGAYSHTLSPDLKPLTTARQGTPSCHKCRGGKL